MISTTSQIFGGDVVEAGQVLVVQRARRRARHPLCEVLRSGAVAEQLGGLAAGDGVRGLRDRVGVLAFVLLIATEPLVDGEEAQAGHAHLVIVGVALGVALADELGGLVGDVEFTSLTLVSE